MDEEQVQAGSATAAEEHLPLQTRAILWAQQAWRPAATSLAVVLILLFGWGVVNGKHGLSVWEQQRVKDKQLRQQIDDLQQENGRLRQHVEHLKSDPGAIEHEARQQLHYARPGEVIVTLPSQPASATPQQPATK